MNPFRLLALAAALWCTAAQAAAPDSDHDGVPDARDRCPASAAMPSVASDFPFRHAVMQQRLQPGSTAWPVDEHGCEADSDGDGVFDSKDYCPDNSAAALAAGVAPNGCPRQSDADGTPDYRDDCPGTPKGVPADRRGCPNQERAMPVGRHSCMPTCAGQHRERASAAAVSQARRVRHQPNPCRAEARPTRTAPSSG